jgi:hypothetical protein
MSVYLTEALVKALRIYLPIIKEKSGGVHIYTAYECVIHPSKNTSLKMATIGGRNM